MGPYHQNMALSESARCIWAQAGVVHKKNCYRDYECFACRFDRALRRASMENQAVRQQGGIPAGKKGRIEFWQNKLMQRPLWQRPCVHHMKGRIEYRACTNEYRCGNCEFGQYFDDQFVVHAIVKPVDELNIDGVQVPQGFYLHQGHTWAKIEEDNMVRVGMDDFAARLLGPAEQIHVPLTGKAVQQDQAGFDIHRGSQTAHLLSPVSGVVTDRNARLVEDPTLAHRDPYAEGWVLRLHAPQLRDELKPLVIGMESGHFLKKEVDRLYAMIEETAGPLAADGGHLGNDLYGNMPELGWQRLVKAFIQK